MRLRTMTERVDHYGKYTLAPRMHKYGISRQRLTVARPHISARLDSTFHAALPICWQSRWPPTLVGS